MIDLARARRAVAALATVALSTAVHTDAVAASLAATITDQSGANVPEAVVFALPLGAPAPKTPPRAATIDQINKEFVPLVVPVQVGGTVVMPNKDNIRHHVYSFSPAKVFELKLYSGVPAKPIPFDKPGPVALGCNIHDWMVGYVYVVDTPWFAKTAKNGSASLTGLPAGEYEVKVWHPWLRGEPVVQRVAVNADAAVAFKVELKPPPSTPARQ